MEGLTAQTVFNRAIGMAKKTLLVLEEVTEEESAVVEEVVTTLEMELSEVAAEDEEVAIVELTVDVFLNCSFIEFSSPGL